MRRLAVGGMGEIYLARQVGAGRFDRLVVLKTLLPELARQAESVGQFLDEARVAATLNHPNIVATYEVGQWGDDYVIAMEYVRGVNLGRLLQAALDANIEIPLVVAVRIVRDAALALDHAHVATDTSGKSLGIVHRDIGLHNIMVRTDGVTKVVDFGIAQAANRITRTQTGLVKGKLEYMSPEQLVAGKELDARSDQFSLGVVLWELSTRRRLFKSDHELLTIEKVSTIPIPSPSAVDADFPDDLERIIMRMLERERENRFPRCADAGSALDSVLRGFGEVDSQRELTHVVETLVGDELADVERGCAAEEKSPFSRALPLVGNATPEGSTVPLGLSSKTARKRMGSWLAGALLAAFFVGGGTAVWFALSQIGDVARTSREVPQNMKRPLVDVAEPEKGELTTPVLHIRSKPAGATVRAGGEDLGQTPAKIGVLAAEVDHVVTVRKPGYKTRRVNVRMRSGEQKDLSIRLHPTARHKAVPPTAKANGYLSLKTDPWAKVSVDGDPLGSTPLHKVELSPGSHTLHMVNEQLGIDEKRKIVIQPDKILKLNLSLNQE
ncbi:serine/threonine-protein kinase [Myxococcota bacterium]